MRFSGPNAFDDFAQHLRTKVVPAVKNACIQSMPLIGEEIQKEAQQQIGSYQAAIGPYAPWDPLAQSTLEKKERMGYGLGGDPDTPLYATGAFQQDITHSEDPNGLKSRVLTNKSYIAYTELGTDRMPARPVFMPAGLRAAPQVLKIVSRNVLSEIKKVL